MTGNISEQARAAFLAFIMITSVMVAGVAFAGSAAAAPIINDTVVVDDDGGEDYTSIQKAIDTEDANTRIEVRAGTYNEEITIDVDNIEIVGANSSASGTVLDGSGSGNGITVDASDVAVRGLRITDYSNGIRMTNIHSNITFENVDSVGHSSRGMEIRNSADLTDLVLNNVDFSNNNRGIRMATTSSIDGLSIADSEFSNNVQGAYFAQSESDPGQLNDVTISDTEFSNNTEKGIYAEKLSNATIDNVTIDGVTSDTYVVNTGIDINLKYDDYENITIRDSTVANVSEGDPLNGNPSASVAVAIKARGSTSDDTSYTSTPATLDDVTIENVVIEDSFNGLRIGEFGKDYSSGGGPTGLTVTASTFRNNSGYHIQDRSGNLDLTATLNSNANTFDRTVTVEDSSENLTDGIFSSVQTGVNAAEPGNTVSVGTGTYDESVSISTENVTLESAAGADSTTINSTTLGRMNIQDAANNVTVEGFSFVFDNQAIYVRSDNVTIQDNTFELADDTESKGYAVRYEGLTSDGEVRGNTFTGINNTVADEFGNGVVISGPDGHEIADNTFTNNSIGVNVGSQQPAGTLQIANNTFTEQDNYAIALNHDDSGNPDFDITNNNIESNPIGIFALSDGNIDVHDNNIVDSSNEGINATFLTNTQVNATSNWWGSADGPSGQGTGNGASVSENVDFEPFYLNPDRTVLSNESELSVGNLTSQQDFAGIVADDENITVTASGIAADGYILKNGTVNISVVRNEGSSVTASNVTVDDGSAEVDFPLSANETGDVQGFPADTELGTANIVIEQASDNSDADTGTIELVHEAFNLDEGYTVTSVPQPAELHAQNIDGATQWDAEAGSYSTDQIDPDGGFSDPTDLHRGLYVHGQNDDARLGYEFETDTDQLQPGVITLQDGGSWNLVSSNFDISAQSDEEVLSDLTIDGDQGHFIIDGKQSEVITAEDPIDAYDAYWIQTENPEFKERGTIVPEYDPEDRAADLGK